MGLTQFEHAHQEYLKALIQSEILAIADEAGFGFGRGGDLRKTIEALGGIEKVGTQARKRVLQRLTWDLR